MKTLHWIIFAIAFWLILAPLVGDDIIALFLQDYTSEYLDHYTVMIRLLRWDDLFLGLAISVLSLVAVSMEQGSDKYPGLQSMHWMQVMLGAWIAAAPFALSFTYEQFIWSHFITGMLVATFALMQVNYEK